MDDQQFVLEQLLEVNSLYESGNYPKARLILDTLQKLYSQYIEDETEFLEEFFLENKVLLTRCGNEEFIYDNRTIGLRRRITTTGSVGEEYIPDMLVVDKSQRVAKQTIEITKVKEKLE
jgi:hypothetical protein